MGKVTIRDISDEAGVSIATVSRVFHKKNVSQDAVSRVHDAAKRLGYSIPDYTASRPRLIAVIVPRLSNPFYNDILDGIQDTAVRNSYNVIISQSKSEMGFSAAPPPFLAGGIVDGLITLEHSDNLKSLLAMVDPELSIVQCCEYDENLPYPYVSIDNYKAAYNAVTYLESTGRKRIALLNSTTHSLYGKKREEGYADAVRDLGLPLERDLVYHLNTIDLTVGYSAALSLLSQDNRPDAIFTVSDIYAVAVTRAARKLELSVPQDVAVVGFDNIEMAAMNEPPLTTIHQPRYEIGAVACNTLLGMIKKRPQMSKELLLESEIVVRSST